MTTPKGMKYIDVTYTAERIDYEQGDGVFRGEACMRLLVAKDIAEWLVEGGSLAETYVCRLEIIIRNRERLCHGEYVEGSVGAIEIVDDEEA